MTAKQILIARAELEDDVAANYVRMAEGRVRFYLHYRHDEDVSCFSDAIAQIALYLYQEDQVRVTQSENGGVSAESFQEGGVSVRNEYGRQTDLITGYEKLIGDVLKQIDEFSNTRVVRFI